jgi:hypothetical protein
MVHEIEYGREEAAKEGFPGMTGVEFVVLFCDAMRPAFGSDAFVNRIEFEYVEVTNGEGP